MLRTHLESWGAGSHRAIAVASLLLTFKATGSANTTLLGGSLLVASVAPGVHCTSLSEHMQGITLTNKLKPFMCTLHGASI